MLQLLFTALINIFEPFKNYMYVIFIAAFIISIIFIIITVVLIQRSYKKQEPRPTPPVAQKDQIIQKNNHSKLFELPPFLLGLSEYLSKYSWFQYGELSQLFFKAHRYLKRTFPSKDYKYHLPWFLIAGPEKSGKSSMVDDLEELFGCSIPDFYQAKPRNTCYWSFFNDAITFNLKGEFLINENGSNELGWRNFLLLLSRYRAKRPLNGIILTISIADLYGTTALSDDVLAQRARIISNKIKSLQSYIGLRLPIYVILTKVDQVPGFREFAASAPNELRQSALGWSSPYASNVSYNAEHFHDGFVHFEKNLKKLLLSFLTQSENWEQSSGVYIFCNELPKIRTKLQIYIDAICKSDEYQSSPIFRGFYMTGHENGQRSLFLKELFSKKIFKEQGIVEPLKEHLRSSPKAVQNLKIASGIFTMVACLGFWNASKNMQLQKEKLFPILWNMNLLFDRMQKLPLSDRNKMKNIYDECLQQLTALSDQSAKTSFFSIFIPATWFGSFGNELNLTLNRTTQLILIRSLYFDLLIKSRNILQTRPEKDKGSNSLGELLVPTNCYEFKLLQDFVRKFAELYENIKKFNKLRDFNDPSILDELFQYSFQAKLQKRFIEQYSKIDKYFNNHIFPPIDLRPYENDARKTLSLLYQNYYNAIFDSNTAQSLPSRLIEIMQIFDARQKDISIDLLELKKTSISLTNILELFGKEGKTWVDDKYFNPGKPYNEMLQYISNIDLFGEHVSQFLIDQTHIGFENLRVLLRRFNQFMSSQATYNEIPCGVPEGKGIFLSSAIIHLEKTLRLIFEQPYLFIGSKEALKKPLSDSQISFWDMASIRSINKQIEQYKKFSAEKMVDIPLRLHDKTQIILKKGLVNYVNYTLERAQQVESKLEKGLASNQVEILLKSKADYLNNLNSTWIPILEFLEQANLGDTYVTLRKLLSDSVIYTLSHIDNMFEQNEFYKVKDGNFNWWEGKKGSAFQAFGAVDIEGLKKYLEIQLRHLETIKAYAEPLVIFLTSQAMVGEENNKELIAKWDFLIKQINDKIKGKPSSAIIDLELFISDKLNQYNIDNVYTLINESEIHSPSNNFFSERQRIIKRLIMERAEVLIRRRSMENYIKLMEYFNAHIKGKFPFASAPSGSKAKISEVPATILKNFLKLYDKVGGTPEKIFDKVFQLGEFVDENYNWLRQIHEIRIFFDQWINGTTETANPEFDIVVEFRVNREKEANAKNIADAWVKPNETDKLVHTQKGSKIGRWYYGQPFAAGFGWTQGNTDPKPLKEDAQPALSINGREAIFEYNGNWSLLWFFSMQKSNVIEYSAPHETSPYIVKFEIPQDNGQRAVLFNKFSLVQPTKSKKEGNLVYMRLPDFPFLAPELPEKLSDYTNYPYLLEQNNVWTKKSELENEGETAPEKPKKMSEVKPLSETPQAEEASEESTTEESASDNETSTGEE